MICSLHYFSFFFLFFFFFIFIFFFFFSFFIFLIPISYFLFSILLLFYFVFSLYIKGMNRHLQVAAVHCAIRTACWSLGLSNLSFIRRRYRRSRANLCFGVNFEKSGGHGFRALYIEGSIVEKVVDVWGKI